MRNMLFLCFSVAVVYFVVKDTVSVSDIMARFESFEMPTNEELEIYAAQGFYYISIVIALVYVVNKFRRSRNSDN